MENPPQIADPTDIFSHFDFADLTQADSYKLLVSVVMPRPIAWVVSRDEAGAINAAPFSFFNIVSTDPPLVAIAASDRTDKDTLYNIRERGELVIHMVSEDLGEAMNTTAANAPRGVDETQLAGLELVPSRLVDVPRILASPVALECTLFDIITPGPRSTIILARVVYMHIRSDAFEDLSRLYIDPTRLRLIGRMHGAGGYTTTRDLFHIERKSWPPK